MAMNSFNPVSIATELALSVVSAHGTPAPTPGTPPGTAPASEPVMVPAPTPQEVPTPAPAPMPGPIAPLPPTPIAGA